MCNEEKKIANDIEKQGFRIRSTKDELLQESIDNPMGSIRFRLYNNNTKVDFNSNNDTTYNNFQLISDDSLFIVTSYYLVNGQRQKLSRLEVFPDIPKTMLNTKKGKDIYELLITQTEQSQYMIITFSNCGDKDYTLDIPFQQGNYSIDMKAEYKGFWDTEEYVNSLLQTGLGAWKTIEWNSKKK